MILLESSQTMATTSNSAQSSRNVAVSGPESEIGMRIPLEDLSAPTVKFGGKYDRATNRLLVNNTVRVYLPPNGKRMLGRTDLGQKSPRKNRRKREWTISHCF
jgi:hypothetical protein